MAELNLGHVVGPGVPTGGTSGQVLKKNSSTNFDTSWSANDATTIPMSSSDSTSINEAISTYNLGNLNSISDLQTALVTLNGTISNNQFKNVTFGMNNASGLFASTIYSGTLIRFSSTRFRVEVGMGQHAYGEIIGSYNNGTWEWDSLALNSKLSNCKLKSFTVDCTTTPSFGASGYCGELALTNSDIESARIVIPQFARKSGYNYPINVAYEGNVLRLWSPASLESVYVGVVLLFF